MSNESRLAKKLNQRDQEINELKLQIQIREHEAKATHKCKICGALWIMYGNKGIPYKENFWTLASKECGPCCDNAEMGDQIEPIGLMKKLVEERSKNTYDSEADTRKHQQMVAFIIHGVIREFLNRIEIHDIGKLGPHEKPIFDEMTPKLKGVKYGSEEYKAMLAEMKPALDHHYATNRHHPEHFEHGIKDMNLIDLLEMLCDWLASGRRHADGGDLLRSVDINQKRFGYSDELKQIFINTAKWFEEAKL